jgi:hypothetical protein
MEKVHCLKIDATAALSEKWEHALSIMRIYAPNLHCLFALYCLFDMFMSVAYAVGQLGVEHSWIGQRPS